MEKCAPDTTNYRRNFNEWPVTGTQIAVRTLFTTVIMIDAQQYDRIGGA